MNTVVAQSDPERPALIAFGSGKGGVGTSTLTAESARAIARRTDRVLAIDASPHTTDLAQLLGTESRPRVPARPLGDPESHLADYIVGTDVDDLWFVSVADALAPPRWNADVDAPDLVRQCHALDFDCLLIDLPATASRLTTTLFALSDVPVLVTTPDRTAVAACDQMLRESLLRAVDLWLRSRTSFSRPLAGVFGPGARPTAASLTAALPARVRGDATSAVEHFDTYLLLNRVHERAERSLAPVLVQAWRRTLGFGPRPLAPIEERRHSGRDSHAGTEREGADANRQLSGALDAIARTLLDVPAFDDRHPRPIPSDSDAHPARRLGRPRDADRESLRQHCRRLREGVGRFDAIAPLFDEPSDRQTLADDLDAIYREILEWTETAGRDSTEEAESRS
ncbi:MAG: tyrosine-protein kinase family protein, partial [Bradymonadaceae bacterium]